jgi:hypothetical protein
LWAAAGWLNAFSVDVDLNVAVFNVFTKSAAYVVRDVTEDILDLAIGITQLF